VRVHDRADLEHCVADEAVALGRAPAPELPCSVLTGCVGRPLRVAAQGRGVHLPRLLRSGAFGAASLALVFGMGADSVAAVVVPPGTAVVAAPAVAAAPASAVGALFLSGLGSEHTCTADVVDSPTGDVVVTAAHCLDGLTSRTVFAPGYDDGLAPFGTWAVTAAYVDPRWTASRNTDADYAFLIVAPRSDGDRRTVQQVVGADVLANPVIEPAGTVAVEGYASGIDDLPVACSATVYLTGDYPTFDCAGFVDGTSGSPWLADYDPLTRTGLVVGVIGGLDGGGKYDYTSYSSPFDEATVAVYERAVANATPDLLA